MVVDNENEPNENERKNCAQKHRFNPLSWSLLGFWKYFTTINLTLFFFISEPGFRRKWSTVLRSAYGRFWSSSSERFYSLAQWCLSTDLFCFPVIRSCQRSQCRPLGASRYLSFSASPRTSTIAVFWIRRVTQLSPPTHVKGSSTSLHLPYQVYLPISTACPSHSIHCLAKPLNSLGFSHLLQIVQMNFIKQFLLKRRSGIPAYLRTSFTSRNFKFYFNLDSVLSNRRFLKPPITAFHTESTSQNNWKFYGSVNPKIKFWGKSIEVSPKGVLTLELGK